MKIKCISNLFIMSIIIFIFSMNTQAQCIYQSDFESGTMSEWIIEQDSAYISQDYAHGGVNSLKIFKSGGYAQITSADNEFCFGTYTGWFYLTGYYSDVYFRFHHGDSDNFYQLAMIPLNTDNPNLRLLKKVNGTITTLDQMAPIFDLEEWFKMTLERYSNGDIKVYINDTLQMFVNDQTFMTPAQFTFWSYDMYSYFDDFCYDTSFAGLEEKESTGKVVVAPNPAKSEIFLSGIKKEAEVRIIDTFGRIIFKTQAQNKLDVSALIPGYYFIQIMNKNQAPIIQSFYKLD